MSDARWFRLKTTRRRTVLFVREGDEGEQYSMRRDEWVELGEPYRLCLGLRVVSRYAEMCPADEMDTTENELRRYTDGTYVEAEWPSRDRS